ncbi:MAG: nickel-dependent lactate racemase [Anaerolineae bacterium]|nr:nickel-dependent lactate racemase [Anaerolineae bacterium]MDW8102369.1 nickel-dependent lactate racemase [Anaerolineae bacterium]
MQVYSYYEGKRLEYELPEGWNLLAMSEPREAPPLENLASEVVKSVENPIGCPPLSEMVKGLGKGKVVILSEDQTRPTRTGLIILPLLEHLNELGVSDDQVEIIVALGTHRKIKEEELREKLGEEILKRVKVSLHDPDDPNGLVFMGTTSRGTPCWINKSFAEAALKLGVGTINPHYFAGYSGGPKIILPGISGRETIRRNHVLIRHEGTVQGQREGNVIWEDMLETARIAGLNMKIDVLLNTEQEIHRLYAGDVAEAQKAAIEGFLKVYGVPVPSQADITITSSYPLEIDLIQSGKAILLADLVTKPGGTILVLSACKDGAGPLMYETLSQKPTPEQVVDWIAEGKASPTGGPMASRLRRLLQTKNLYLVTGGLTPQQLADMEMGWFPGIEEALTTLKDRYIRADVLVLPVGGASFPYLEKVA